MVRRSSEHFLALLKENFFFLVEKSFKCQILLIVSLSFVGFISPFHSIPFHSIPFHSIPTFAAKGEKTSPLQDEVTRTSALSAFKMVPCWIC